MDFEEEIAATAVSFGVSYEDALIIVSRRFLDHPMVTPLSKAMIEVLLADIGEVDISWQ